MKILRLKTNSKRTPIEKVDSVQVVGNGSSSSSSELEVDKMKNEISRLQSIYSDLHEKFKTVHSENRNLRQSLQSRELQCQDLEYKNKKLTIENEELRNSNNTNNNGRLPRRQSKSTLRSNSIKTLTNESDKASRSETGDNDDIGTEAGSNGSSTSSGAASAAVSVQQQVSQSIQQTGNNTRGSPVQYTWKPNIVYYQSNLQQQQQQQQHHQQQQQYHHQQHRNRNHNSNRPATGSDDSLDASDRKLLAQAVKAVRQSNNPHYIEPFKKAGFMGRLRRVSSKLFEKDTTLAPTSNTIGSPTLSTTTTTTTTTTIGNSDPAAILRNTVTNTRNSILVVDEPSYTLSPTHLQEYAKLVPSAVSSSKADNSNNNGDGDDTTISSSGGGQNIGSVLPIRNATPVYHSGTAPHYQYTAYQLPTSMYHHHQPYPQQYFQSEEQQYQQQKELEMRMLKRPKSLVNISGAAAIGSGTKKNIKQPRPRSIGN